MYVSIYLRTRKRRQYNTALQSASHVSRCNVNNATKSQILGCAAMLGSEENLYNYAKKCVGKARKILFNLMKTLIRKLPKNKFSGLQ
jgi:hypothetical protein